MIERVETMEDVVALRGDAAWVRDRAAELAALCAGRETPELAELIGEFAGVAYRLADEADEMSARIEEDDERDAAELLARILRLPESERPAWVARMLASDDDGGERGGAPR